VDEIEAHGLESQLERARELGVIKVEFFRALGPAQPDQPITHPTTILATVPGSKVPGPDQSPPISAKAIEGKAVDCCVG